jgi:hypothetical protein
VGTRGFVCRDKAADALNWPLCSTAEVNAWISMSISPWVFMAWCLIN